MGWSSCVYMCFNPRPRAGGDKFDAGYFNDTNVSIHAPARGATTAKRIALRLG